MINAKKFKNQKFTTGFTPLESQQQPANIFWSEGDSRLPALTNRQITHRPWILTGFTLIELLVVVTIIGIIATITLISLQSVRMKARDSRRVSDIRQLMMAFELSYDDHLEYPEKGIVGVIAKPPAAIAPYLEETPEDPGNIVLACQPEGYRWWGNAGQSQKYCLWACLEVGTFFAASPKGAKTLSNSPSGLDCW